MMFTGYGFAKCLIFGEYAVMYGAPGLIVALDAPFEVSLADIKSTPLLNQIPKFSTHFEERLDSILALDCQNRLWPPITANVSLNARFFYDKNNHKIGIGSSAAAIVALVQAKLKSIFKTSGMIASENEFIQLAIQLHRILQNNLGSGIDIIASTCGGTIMAQNCDKLPQWKVIADTSIPPFVLIVTHHYAPTVDFISASHKHAHTKEFKKIITQLSEIYCSLSKIVEHPSTSDFLSQIQKITPILRNLGSLIDMPVIPPLYDELFPLAEESDVILKTSGAGGGDIFIAFADSQDKISNFITKLPPGITALDVPVAPMRNIVKETYPIL